LVEIAATHPKRKRNYDPLSQTAHQSRYAAVSSKQYLLTSSTRNHFAKSWLQKLRSHVIKSRRTSSAYEKYWQRFYSQEELVILGTVLLDQIPENVNEYVAIDDPQIEIFVLNTPEDDDDYRNDDDNYDKDVGNDIDPVRKIMTRAQALDRRHALKYCFSYLYGSPPEEAWKELDLISALCATLAIPYNSRLRV